MDPMGYFIDGRLWMPGEGGVVGLSKMIETGGLEQMSCGTWAYANVQFLFYPFLGLRVCICQQKCIHKSIYIYTYTSIVSPLNVPISVDCYDIWEPCWRDKNKNPSHHWNWSVRSRQLCGENRHVDQQKPMDLGFRLEVQLGIYPGTPDSGTPFQ